jgi:hypothetical protein
MTDGTNEKPAGQETAPAPRKLPITIKLRTPIEVGEGAPLEAIVIKREPNGADWSGFNVQNATILDYQKVAARIANLPLPIIKKVDSKATFEIVEVVGSFLE